MNDSSVLKVLEKERGSNVVAEVLDMRHMGRLGNVIADLRSGLGLEKDC